jgi:hypothetical protein
MAIEVIRTTAIIEHGFDESASGEAASIEATFLYESPSGPDWPVHWPEKISRQRFMSQAIMSGAVRLLFDIDRAAHPLLLHMTLPLGPKDTARLSQLFGESFTHEVSAIGAKQARATLGLFVMPLVLEPENVIHLTKLQISQPDTPPEAKAQCLRLLRLWQKQKDQTGQASD